MSLNLKRRPNLYHPPGGALDRLIMPGGRAPDAQALRALSALHCLFSIFYYSKNSKSIGDLKKLGALETSPEPSPQNLSPTLLDFSL